MYFFKDTYTGVIFFCLEPHDESHKRRRRETPSEEEVVAQGKEGVSHVCVEIRFHGNFIFFFVQ